VHRWCHGATGILPLLAASLTRAPALGFSSDFRSAILSALERAAALTYARGLLRKGPGLCHGAAGTVSVLFHLADCTALPTPARERYLWHAIHLAACIAELAPRGVFATPDRPWSLFEGAAGACAAVALVVARIDALLGGSGSTSNARGGLLGAADLLAV